MVAACKARQTQQDAAGTTTRGWSAKQLQGTGIAVLRVDLAVTVATTCTPTVHHNGVTVQTQLQLLPMLQANQSKALLLDIFRHFLYAICCPHLEAQHAPESLADTGTQPA
jgi:hypothetical protein